MKICMMGTGYVGLVSGACFAETGNEVVCADVDEDKIRRLRAGDIVIFEPGLGPMVERNVASGRLSFSSDVPAAIAGAEVVFVAVGTPPRSDGAADLSAVDRVAETVVKYVAGPLVLVLKSTVPVGTNARVRRIVKDAPYPVQVVSNPEFLKEGDAVSDFLRPDRIVVGCDADDHHAREIMRRLYHPVCLASDRMVWMDPPSAELSKYVANTLLAMRISFMNEVAWLCEKVGADIHHVRHGVGSDARIGPRFLYAGPGYGGSCFPKDVVALVSAGREHGVEMELAGATDRVNQRQKGALARKLKQIFEGDLRGKCIGVWGIAFKPRTDDIREAPALALIEALLSEGAMVRAHDPQAAAAARERFGGRIALCEDAYEAARDADALVLVTEWRQYQNPDFPRLRQLMRRPVLLDGRNIWSGYGLRAQGFHYEGIGVKGS
ncbi:MAG: UDP-glucose/GDP-mannose dehydrogenase family protein [Deltaproteobacteria bacterium]|nr:UDP-glucose/GDP-mannose dehydrogenase family protein [Deltaproteobacteria bacterium]